MWRGEVQVEALYRAVAATTSCYFKSNSGKFLSLSYPRLASKGTLFEIVDGNVKVPSGRYLGVDGDVRQKIRLVESDIPDVFWDGKHLLRRSGGALDIFEYSSKDVWLWTYNGTDKQVWSKVDVSISPKIALESHAEASATETSRRKFTLVQYNLCFSFMGNSACAWESELRDKTMEGGRGIEKGSTVKLKNTLWRNRFQRLINNMLVDGRVPDILLLQETSPAMLEFLMEKMNIPNYKSKRSSAGCCGDYNGYCYVCWNPEMFGEASASYSPPLEDSGHTRFVAVTLEFDGIPFTVCSTHLPTIGFEENVSFLTKDYLKSNKTRIIIGGDFNVDQNVFRTTCPENLSNADPTFHNGGDYWNEKTKKYSNWAETVKYDWVVASRKAFEVESVGINRADNKSRWPDEIEGSDHTATRLKLAIR